ncbi:hypothetical protein MXD62_33725 [Frankia sp. Mgl5]|uniref:hypothetical protein n=1 Tax=Frankia sp. Mgl5 TaxID=2933793 RepID=UPI00200F0CC5|nr:hypothetical protein [Frankia sp. Mgl5]MCK9932040.1 hypothetical protein [Frankia sp. Mgl5]
MRAWYRAVASHGGPVLVVVLVAGLALYLVGIYAGYTTAVIIMGSVLLVGVLITLRVTSSVRGHAKKMMIDYMRAPSLQLRRRIVDVLASVPEGEQLKILEVSLEWTADLGYRRLEGLLHDDGRDVRDRVLLAMSIIDRSRRDSG